jgi:hypothetical protein
VVLVLVVEKVFMTLEMALPAETVFVLPHVHLLHY